MQNLSLETIGSSIRDLVDKSLAKKGAVLVRGLNYAITNNNEFSKLVDFIGSKFSYTAGFATRNELPNAPGFHFFWINPYHCCDCRSCGCGWWSCWSDHRASSGDVLQSWYARFDMSSLVKLKMCSRPLLSSTSREDIILLPLSPIMWRRSNSNMWYEEGLQGYCWIWFLKTSFAKWNQIL